MIKGFPPRVNGVWLGERRFKHFCNFFKQLNCQLDSFSCWKSWQRNKTDRSERKWHFVTVLVFVNAVSLVNWNYMYMYMQWRHCWMTETAPSSVHKRRRLRHCHGPFHWRGSKRSRKVVSNKLVSRRLKYYIKCCLKNAVCRFLNGIIWEM